MSDLTRFEFYGDVLDVSKHGDRLLVALRPVCEALGIALQSQLFKLKSKPWATITEIVTVAEDGRARAMSALDIDAFPMWLAGIDTRKVRESARGKLVRYQMECARVLRDHFFPRDVGPSHQPLPLDIAHAPYLGDVPNLRDDIDALCRMTARAAGVSLRRVHGFIRKTYRVPGIYQVSVLAWTQVRQTLEAIALGRILIPRVRAKVLALVPKGQLPLLPGEGL